MSLQQIGEQAVVSKIRAKYCSSSPENADTAGMYQFVPKNNQLYKVKRGNLERKLDFGTCCSRKFCSKSKTMFVWEAHLSTVKASKNCLTSLLYLEHTADQLLQGAKIGRWGNLERFLFGHIATVILHDNHGNTSIELLLDVRLFICL